MDFNNLTDALAYAAQIATGQPCFIYFGIGGLCHVTTIPFLDDFEVALCVQWLDGPRGAGIYTGIVSTTQKIDLGKPLPVLMSPPPVSRTGNCPQCSMPIQRELKEGVTVECPSCGLMLTCHEGSWEIRT